MEPGGAGAADNEIASLRARQLGAPDGTIRPALWARCGLNGMKTNGFEIILPVRDYDLDATLASGQVFGWERGGSVGPGVASGRWVELTATRLGFRRRRW